MVIKAVIREVIITIVNGNLNPKKRMKKQPRSEAIKTAMLPSILRYDLIPVNVRTLYLCLPQRVPAGSQTASPQPVVMYPITANFPKKMLLNIPPRAVIKKGMII